LAGSTFIKQGITSSMFKTVPDSPFNSLEPTLPRASAQLSPRTWPRAPTGLSVARIRKNAEPVVAQNGFAKYPSEPRPGHRLQDPDQSREARRGEAPLGAFPDGGVAS
jgi:hypothetical protein